VDKLKIIRATTVPKSLKAFCNGMLNELSEKYEILAISSPGVELEDVAKQEGVRVIAVPMERHISILRDCCSLWKMWRIFLKENPNMVHSMTPKAGMICMVAALMARVPVRVHTFTGLIFPTSIGIKRRILMFTDWLTCACATHIIPEGEGVKNDLLNNRITKKPLKVLGYGNVRGIDLDVYSRIRIVNGSWFKYQGIKLMNPDAFTFLFVGRIVGDKGINELCQAFLRIHSQCPLTRLWLIGEYEENIDPLRAETKAIIVDNQSGIEAVGPKRGDELLSYYAVADCFVMPSYREGFPNTVIEAGAMGLPCIVTDVNGSREIIEEGVNGMIIPSKDSNALYYAMFKMMHDVTMRSRMSSVARKMISDRFEQSYVRNCLYNFYDEILKNENFTEKTILQRVKSIWF